MTHDEFTLNVNREAIRVKFTMGARMLIFKRHPELKEKVYTKSYLIIRTLVNFGHVAGVLLVFVVPLYVALAVILYSHYISTRLILYVDSFMLEMALADRSFYEYAVHRKYIKIKVVPWALKELQAG